MTTFLATGTAFHSPSLMGTNLNGAPIFDPTPIQYGSYRPILSTISGAFRVLLGVIHTVVHLASTLFDFKNREHHMRQVGIGVMNMLKGLIEIVPVLGNIASLAIDAKIVENYMKDEFIKKHPNHEAQWKFQVIAKALWDGVQ